MRTRPAAVLVVLAATLGPATSTAGGAGAKRDPAARIVAAE
jgi:hypothetical protein